MKDHLLTVRSVAAHCSSGLVAALAAVSLAAAGAAALAHPVPGVELVDLWLAHLSLLAPLVLVLGSWGGLVAAWVRPVLVAVWRHLGARAASAYRLQLSLLLGAGAALLAVVAGAIAVLRWWSVPNSSVSAGVVAAGSVLGLLFALLSFAVCVASSVAAAPRWGRVGSLLGAVCLLAGGLGVGAWMGSTSGDGSWLSVLGVLRREGLHAERAVLPVVVLTVSCLGASLVRGRWPGFVFALCLSVALSWAAALHTLSDSNVSVAVERAGGFSSTLLVAARNWSDWDGDGVSSLYGEGDCAAHDPQTYPGARDVPGNGRDEDCSGMDAPLPKPKPKPKLSQEQWLAKRRIDNLGVVLITVDTLRYDLGYTGYERDITPNIDALAKRSAVFEKAYALASYTGKSLGPMLIGRYPSETHRGWWHFNRFDERETFVQERLQAAGVKTIGVQGHWYFTPKYGLGRGFDVLDMSAMPRKQPIEGDRTVNSDKLTDAAIARLSDSQNTEGPFFLWVHYLDPHAEYMRHAGLDFGNKGRDLYDSEVAFTDRHIGRLLDFISQSDLSSRTAIVFTSDHGESFGENDFWRHGFEVWETLVRVPLVVHVPGAEPVRIAKRRSSIDLVPTLLELYGLELPQGEERLSGVDLSADIWGPPGHHVEERPILVDMSAGPYNTERRAFIVDDKKWITSAGRTLGLYDLKRDPDESEDLSGSNPELLARIQSRWEEFQADLRPVKVRPRKR